MLFAQNLKAILKDRNLKQIDLHNMTGISTSLISDYINGNKEPGLNYLFAIANALNLTIDELINYCDNSKASDFDPSLAELEAKLKFLIRMVPPEMRHPLFELIEAAVKTQRLL